MPVPNHGPFCTTWMYETSCWHCHHPIFILQCSCGSAVLFDERGPPWPRHNCSGFAGHTSLGSKHGDGIGGSGMSGWTAIDQLRSSGMPVTPEIMKGVFGEPVEITGNKPVNPDIEAIPPESGQSRDVIVSMMEFHKDTSSTEYVNNLSSIARQMGGIPAPRGQFMQMTLHHSYGVRRDSYTALIDSQIAPTGMRKHCKKHSIFQVRMFATKQFWIIKELYLL